MNIDTTNEDCIQIVLDETDRFGENPNTAVRFVCLKKEHATSDMISSLVKKAIKVYITDEHITFEFLCIGEYTLSFFDLYKLINAYTTSPLEVVPLGIALVPKQLLLDEAILNSLWRGNFHIYRCEGGHFKKCDSWYRVRYDFTGYGHPDQAIYLHPSKWTPEDIGVFPEEKQDSKEYQTLEDIVQFIQEHLN